MDSEDSSQTALRRLLSSKIFCEEARRLLESFAETVQELIALHEQQFQAVVAGDPEANRFDLLIHGANERKREAKYAYLSHLHEHGCSHQNATYAR